MASGIGGIEQETRVERTGEERAVLRGLLAGQALTHDAAGWRLGTRAGGVAVAVAEAVIAKLVRDELLAVSGGMPRLATATETGLAWAERDVVPGSYNRVLVGRGRAGREAVSANLAENPLAWLMRRGKISKRQFAAGERLRADHAMAERAPATTMRWDGMPGGGRQGSAEGALDPTQAQIAAKRRFEAAASAAGPGLADVLLRVACRGEGLEAAERAFGWPARAGKVVLALALDRVAAFYGV